MRVETGGRPLRSGLSGFVFARDRFSSPRADSGEPVSVSTLVDIGISSYLCVFLSGCRRDESPLVARNNLIKRIPFFVTVFSKLSSAYPVYK